jgi:HEAT repeat protein
VLVDIVHHDEASAVRASAAEALARFVLLGELGKIRPRPFQAAVAALKERYSDPAETLEVRRRAVEGLAYISDDQVVATIDDAYGHADEGMRASAVLAMGRSGDRQWSKVILRELANPDPEMRLQATRACGELQLREAVDDVAELAQDVDVRIRAAALWALGQIGGSVAKGTLNRYAESDEPALAEVAQDALRELEFLFGDLTSFFGPPSEYDGESDERWHFPDLDDLVDEVSDLEDELPDDQF